MPRRRILLASLPPDSLSSSSPMILFFTSAGSRRSSYMPYQRAKGKNKAVAPLLSSPTSLSLFFSHPRAQAGRAAALCGTWRSPMQRTSTMVNAKTETEKKKRERQSKKSGKKRKKARQAHFSLDPDLLLHCRSSTFSLGFYLFDYHPLRTLHDAPQARCPRGRHLRDLHDGQGEEIGPESARIKVCRGRRKR